VSSPRAGGGLHHFIIELRWSFDKYRERLRKLLAFGSRRSSEYLVKNL
jgi:hypothetical protein